MRADTWVSGSQLSGEDRRHVLCAYVHRYTKDHKPQWAMGARGYPVQFASDQDWLRHTQFKVRKDGRLDMRVKRCFSRPIWPDNPELRGGPNASEPI